MQRARFWFHRSKDAGSKPINAKKNCLQLRNDLITELIWIDWKDSERGQKADNKLTSKNSKVRNQLPYLAVMQWCE